MVDKLSLAVAGIGNNISALLQGVYFYRHAFSTGDTSTKFPGIRNNVIGGLAVGDIDIVAGFDTHPAKIGLPIREAVFSRPNNYIDLGQNIDGSINVVLPGLYLQGDAIAGKRAVLEAVRASRAEILLYSLPTGLQWAAEGYAECALEAGVGFVNCTPEVVARNPQIMAEFERRGLALIGDDLASHMGTSMLHRAILNLIVDRGLDLESSYQLNFGGNEDFRNLRDNGASKATSKKNALARPGLNTDLVEIIPSAGVINHLQDRKVAYVNIVARGWANTPIHIDLKLEVQDSSNAAGVIIDLIRIACITQRQKVGGFNAAAASFLKSPPGGQDVYTDDQVTLAFGRLNESL